MAMDELETDKTETQAKEAAVETATSVDEAKHPAGDFVWSAALGALAMWPWGAVFMTLPHRKALAAQKMEWKYCGHMVLITLFTWLGMIVSRSAILIVAQNFPMDNTIGGILYAGFHYAICIAVFIIIGRHAAKYLAKAVPNYPKEIYRKKERVGIIANVVILTFFMSLSRT